MNYKVNVGWSKSNIVITIIIFMIVIAAGYSCLMTNQITIGKIIIISLLTIVLMTIGLLIPFKIEITNKELLIYRFIGVKHVLITNISDCGLSYIPISVKVCGSGGFCGNIGWYKAPDFGIYFSYVLNKKRAFYLILKNRRKYMLSCNDPDKIVSVIKELQNNTKS